MYSLDYVPGIMDQNGLMFGLFHMSRLIDLGHLALGALALLGGLISARAARIYFWVLGVWYTIDVATYFLGHLHNLSLTNNCDGICDITPASQDGPISRTVVSNYDGCSNHEPIQSFT